MQANEPQIRRSNLTLWLVLAVCVAPFLAAVVVQRYFPPSSRMNYGELIEPAPLADIELPTVENKPYSLKTECCLTLLTFQKQPQTLLFQAHKLVTPSWLFLLKKTQLVMKNLCRLLGQIYLRYKVKQITA